MQNIPRGIEVLVKKAAVDPQFRHELLEKRSASAESIGLVLSSPEKMLIDTVPAGQLQAIVNGTKVEPSALPALLGKVAAVMLIALGVTTAATSQNVTINYGIRVQTSPAEPASHPATASAPASAPAKIAQILKKMDSTDYQQRQAAQQELEQMGKAIVPELKLAQQDPSLSAEVRYRIGLVLDKLNPPPQRVEIVEGVRAR